MPPLPCSVPSHLQLQQQLSVNSLPVAGSIRAFGPSPAVALSCVKGEKKDSNI